MFQGNYTTALLPFLPGLSFPDRGEPPKGVKLPSLYRRSLGLYILSYQYYFAKLRIYLEIHKNVVKKNLCLKTLFCGDSSPPPRTYLTWEALFMTYLKILSL